MDRHTTAKVVVIIDSHAMDNGYFAWTGTKGGHISACSLLQVRKASLSLCSVLSHPLQLLEDCSPDGIFRYLSNDPVTKPHNHKCLIVNLACGNSILNDHARSELLDG